MSDEARGVFSVEALPGLEAYAALLCDEGVVRGLIGPREGDRIWDRHLVGCGLLAEVLPRDVAVCDIGSGAGLPGLVLALTRPDLRVTLVEPLLRRTTYLEEAVDRLRLDNVEVVRGRADALHGERRFDVVTSRAVAPLERLLRWSMPLVAPDGVLLAMKGRSVADEVPEARGVIDELGLSDPEVSVVGEGRVAELTTVVRVAWADPSSVGWPPPGAPRRAKSSRGRSGGRKGGRAGGR